jgi:hypothetical protein
MPRSALSMFAVAAVIALSPMRQPVAQAQATPATEFNQLLLDAWLRAVPAMAELNASANAPKTDEETRPHMERVCTEASFASFAQCGTTIAYAGILFSGFDPRSGTFKNPADAMRERIAAIEGNARMPSQVKQAMLAPMKEAAAGFPRNIPDTHLRLMADNRDRIFKSLKSGRKP